MYARWKRGAAALLAAVAMAAAPGGAARAAAGAAQATGAPIRLALIEGMSGPFADAGAAVERNLRFGVERVNARGGVALPDGRHPLELVVLDSKGSTEAALVQLRAAADRRIGFVLQGNSSAVAAALVTAIDRQNAREPDNRELFLNYSADDPALTNAGCSFWHFRFDAHAGMRMDALADVIAADPSVKKVYLLNQDYSFGHDVSALARGALAAKRPDIAVVGDEFHPIGRVKDFAPYLAKIRAAGADAVITGNWGSDLTLLVKAAREQGLDTKFYTFYGNSLGAPAALGEAGVKRVYAVADWHPNAGGAASDAWYAAYRARFPEARDDYPVLRMEMLVEMLAQAIAKAGSAQPDAVARALEGMRFDNGFHPMQMRADDHQVIQPLYVMQMDKAGTPRVRFDNEGSGYGFRTVLALPAERTAPATVCRMKRP
ncbi:amino acid/amide ABC transporter substrate-binding protein, HAAT family [Paraburkholderia caballeronis]|uniref:Amino acid/amide ABC transporter substrate-binding protein, HAAT family n=2 Tax=Paraburkholderia caballeronis TaxID=416943 RepID=A0A1H7T8W0_9BURK|nr:branched-chain amino acid ABC transporter substrate-binding protein [Paraburkholderia caballeronis]PXW22657.1 amino acid/amide ABC transporter substrate-binding protein (HAAT family) [Paraburkholderia caballeronis]PXW96760.1 amino acid/amide ABC transporter substrate-binding protein (HAAT family) [Paraburkholderia caballeronis]RAJ93387.1 amino acid/amide ABC transporter substrate-binding protein (HAAT family) [Paraburkholderia caballeronis]SEC69130.1 amino acid/amide ABC transporter substrat